MAALTKREFTELALDGSNYLTWALDVEIYLTSTELQDTIIANSTSDAAQKAKSLIFLRHHLNHDLKNEYLTENDPYILWKSLKDRFDQQISLVLPQAQYDWLNLRFQDYKSVTEYNSILHKIVSQLKLCKQEVSDKDLIEKTLSTFHASNLVLQQQYRAKNYTQHAELISALLVAEKHNQLLMRNHNARPVGSAPVPEAHNVAQSNNTRGAEVEDEEEVVEGVRVVEEEMEATRIITPATKIGSPNIKDNQSHQTIIPGSNKPAIGVGA
ncbi:PREDICTED: uncharacterized protein LOC109191595 [Ipomoea nil]|uniref:uncharacterized protein LOC109150718 n=1 Tax=Ipomoea nil TaxID=35883 RepID=UPI0009012F40|nr:PREDICTED: uncharacterized protein LOC109150718 [Ipomoea nil]XP_019197749.1 PREDICTED: uncharacterized protein LOC109191595 [Ipomoea nil]